jgi:adenylosuccinate synthase
MPVTLIIGGQWGDEGKAKIIDHLARNADFVVRYQGGANAGHTVVVGEKRFAFHLVPSGILYPHITCIVGGGMVVDPIALVDEIRGVSREGIDVAGRIFISDQAHLVLPYHQLMDQGSEKKLGNARIGTTGKGIMPAYVDKVGRCGVRMSDLLRSSGDLTALISKKIREKNRQLKQLGFPTVPVKSSVENILRAKKKLQPMIIDTRPILWAAVEKGKSILCEGAQGTFLDIDHGTYPYVTSSYSSAGGAVVGTGLPPSAIGSVIGVFKAYCTRVGNGPFPTEEKRAIGDRLRDLGNEYGTTTGRPRRCGWFDAVAARTAVKLNGITEIALTKLDVLDTFDEIKVCTSYRSGKRELEYFPTDVRTVERCRPDYQIFEGWKVPSSTGDPSHLPHRAEEYVHYLEELVRCKIKLISTGPERDSIKMLS